MHGFLIALLALCALLNLVASVAVLRATSMPPARRALQLALVWLVPLVGAALCLAFVIADNARPGTAPELIAPVDVICGDGLGAGPCNRADGGGGDGD